MTSILDPLPLSECDDPAAVLAHARGRKRVEDDAARDVMRAAARWASMHSGDSVVGPADGWHETCLPLGGEGCPEVAEFAVTEFAAALASPPRPAVATCRMRSRGSTGSPAAGPGWRPASCRPGGWGSLPNAPCASHPRPRRSWTGTSLRWRTGSARSSWPG